MCPYFLRITGGEFKGRLIKVPLHRGLRPTTEKVREALFDILGERVKGGVFLDLFCGSGAVGIEAMSRGAERVFFLDKDKRCIRRVKESLKFLKTTARASLINLSASRGLKSLQTSHVKFNIVFIDPPYGESRDRSCLINIADYDILTPNAWCILERAKDERPLVIDGLGLFKEYRYGGTILTLYRRKDGQ